MATKIAILSDVHVPGPGRLAGLLSEAVEKIRTLSCDHVVLLGDAVEFGRAEEYAIVKSILSPLQIIMRPLVGNHELLEGTIADFRTTWAIEPYTADLIENLPVMRFNTAIPAQPEDEYFGTVDDRQLSLLDAVLSTRHDSPALIFSHHPLANTVRRSDEKNLMIDNSPALRDRMARHGASAVVFSGHTHAQSFVQAERLTCVGCPSLGYWPHAFVVATIDRAGVKFETHQLITDPAASPDPGVADEEYRLANQGDASDRSGQFSF